MAVMVKELTGLEIAEAGEIRVKVFVEEQGVPLAEEFDEQDRTARHFGIFKAEKMVGTARLIANNDTAVIGRIALLKEARKQGLGTILLQTIIAEAKKGGMKEILIGAQLQALDFYNKLGFKAEGAVFMDGGIPHQSMRLKL